MALEPIRTKGRRPGSAALRNTDRHNSGLLFLLLMQVGRLQWYVTRLIDAGREASRKRIAFKTRFCVVKIINELCVWQDLPLINGLNILTTFFSWKTGFLQDQYYYWFCDRCQVYRDNFRCTASQACLWPDWLNYHAGIKLLALSLKYNCPSSMLLDRL